MAEDKQYSEQTKAIIDRLKAEGDLSRNSGTNSIKEVIKRLQGVQEETKQASIDTYYGLQQVRLEIGRFSDVFQSISANTARQTEMIKSSINLEETIDNIFEEQKKLLEESIKSDQEKLKFDREQVEETKREEAVARVEQAAERANEPPPSTDEEGDSKADKKTGGLFSLLKKFRLTLKNILLLAGGVFVGFNVIKGIINEITGGGFDRFQAAAIEGFKIFTDLLTDPGVVKTLVTMATIAGPLAVFLKLLPIVTTAIQAIQAWKIFSMGRKLEGFMTGKMAVAAGATTGARVATAGDFGLTGAAAAAAATTGAETQQVAKTGLGAKIKGLFTVPTAAESKGLLKSAFSLRSLMFAGAATTMLSIGDSLISWFNTKQSEMNIDELADAPMTEFESAGETINTVAGFATFGMMFGPKGAIAGAIIGGVYSLGKAAYDKINDYFNDTDVIANETQAALKIMRETQRAGGDPRKAFEAFALSQRETKEKIQTEINANNMEIDRLQRERDQKIERMRKGGAADYQINGMMEKYADDIAEIQGNTQLRIEQLKNVDKLVEQAKAELPKTPEDELEELTARFVKSFEIFKGNATPTTIVSNNNTPVINNNTNNYSVGGTQQAVMLAAAGGGSSGGQLWPGGA